MGAGAPVYLAAVMEYLAAEVLELEIMMKMPSLDGMNFHLPGMRSRRPSADGLSNIKAKDDLPLVRTKKLIG